MARNLIVRALEFVLDTGIAITAPALAFLVRRMATTGVGTDTCLKWKCLPVPVHFYSPIPDLEDLEKRGIWDARSAMPGVDWNPPGQLELLTALGEKFGSECRWPRRAAGFSQSPLPEDTNAVAQALRDAWEDEEDADDAEGINPRTVRERLDEKVPRPQVISAWENMMPA